jgi:glycosyltransferase involved in cell wall biosynthesis
MQLKVTTRLAILGTRGIPAQYGGFETFAEKLSIGLVKRGIEVTVYCEEVSESPASFENVNLKYFKVPKLGPLSTIFFDVRCLWHARSDYDVVYMLGYGASFFCFVPRLWGTKVWINMDGIEWARSKWSWIAKLWLRSMESVAMWTANRIIADAEGIRDFLAARHNRLPPASVIAYGAPVIEDAPDLSLLAEWGLQCGRYYLVVCRLEPENHVMEILNGYSLASTSMPLIIVGNHDVDTGYVRSLKELKSDRIRFIGAIYNHEKLLALRYHCAAYFHGHSVGGTNPSLLEAMGCGNTIIAHENPFNREVAAEAAVYFKEATDIPDLIDKIETSDATQRAQDFSRSITRIRQFYSWDAIVDQYMKLIESQCRNTVPDSAKNLMPAVEKD